MKVSKNDRRIDLVGRVHKVLMSEPLDDRLFACMTELTYTLTVIEDDEAMAEAIAKVDEFWTAMKAALIMANKP